jgi:hypothetical protein
MLCQFVEHPIITAYVRLGRELAAISICLGRWEVGRYGVRGASAGAGADCGSGGGSSLGRFLPPAQAPKAIPNSTWPRPGFRIRLLLTRRTTRTP